MEVQLGNVVLLLTLAIATYQDIKEMKINIWLPIVSVGLGMAWRIIVVNGTWIDIFQGSLMGAICLMISWISNECIGTGDGLMLMVSGIFLGFWKNCIVFIFAIGMVGLVGLYMFAVKKKGRNYKMPFLPYLLAAYICVLL